jgi:hypothetical protein
MVLLVKKCENKLELEEENIKFMISNRVYRAKKEIELLERMVIKSGQELEIVMDVVYVNGTPNLQNLFYSYIVNNPTSFDDVTKIGKWKILKYLTQ